jgi:hypothetical protein
MQIIRLLFTAMLYLSFNHVALAMTSPGDAIASANARSARAEQRLSSCGQQFRGAAAIRCVASAVNAYARSIGSCNHIASVAPEAAPAVADAARGISGASAKASAASVLRRTRSVLRNLAAQSKGEARAVYNRINRAFQRAVDVINRRA